MSDEICYIVLGRQHHADEFRRARGLRARQVIAGCGPHSLRGLAGRFVVFTHESYPDLPRAWREAIDRDVQVLRARGYLVEEGL